MKELEMLLNQRWILKAEDKELYYRVIQSESCGNTVQRSWAVRSWIIP